MRPNARTTSENTSPRKPPTAWRTLRPSKSQNEEYPAREWTHEPLPEAGNRHPTNNSLGRSSVIQRHSNELSIRQHVTKDSMLDNLLFSFNYMPDGQGPHPKQPPLYSSFKDGEFKLESPRFVYDALSQMSTHSRSSSISSEDDLQKSKSTFSPYQIRHTPIRASSRSVLQVKATPKSATYLSNKPIAPIPATISSASKLSVQRDSTFSMQGAADIGKWTKRRSRTMSNNPELPPTDGIRRLSSSNTRTGPLSISVPRSINSGRDRSPIRSDPVSHESGPTSARSAQVPTMDNFRPQTSSRNKIAVLAGSEAILAPNRFTHVRDSARQSTAEESPPILRATSSKETNLRPSVDVPRERPGFFKRVFGSSRSNIHNTLTDELRAPAGESPSRNTEATSAKRLKMSEAALQSQPTGTGTYLPDTTADGPPPLSYAFDAIAMSPTSMSESPVLNKKASFFRRRKRIASDSKEIPEQNTIAPLILRHPESPPESYDPSISSLRKVMGPFLNSSTEPIEPIQEHRTHSIASDDNTSHSLSSASSPTTSRKAGATRNVAGCVPASPVRTSVQVNRASPISNHVQGPPARVSVDADMRSRTNGRNDLLARQESPVSLLSAQLRSTQITQPRTTPPGLVQQVEYPPSLHESRGIGTALTTDLPSPLPVTSEWHDNSTLMRQSVIQDMDDDETPKLLRRVWIEPDDSDEQQSPMSSPPAQRLFIPASSGRLATMTWAEGAVDRSSIVEAPSNVGIAVSTLEDLTPAMPLTVTTEATGQAQKIYNGADDAHGEEALLLGLPGVDGDDLRRLYMDLFDFAGLNILNALRTMCGKLALKGETQQVDRILSAFASRWCDCNNHHGFKSQDIVHTIAYSLLLLNTDLHIADIDQKMTRIQFVRNTLPTIRRVLDDEAPEVEPVVKTPKGSMRSSVPWLDAIAPRQGAPDLYERRPSLETRVSEGRLSVRHNFRPTSAVSSLASPSAFESRFPEMSDALVDYSIEGPLRVWESQIESILRDFYISIRQQRLPLHGVAALQLHDDPSNTSLAKESALRRTGSVLSRPANDTRRTRAGDFRSVGSRWNTRNRSRPKLYTASSIGSGRTSVDEQSPFSPSGSSTWSRSYGRTQTTHSTDSLGTYTSQNDAAYQQSIGFANALSQAMVRTKGVESTAEDEQLEMESHSGLEDETLQLAGAPWAKEGIVHHKHHLETNDKKARDRNWVECFAVVENGNMRLFSFTSKASMRSRKNKSLRGGAVGGGNWMDSAESLGSFVLRQTLANTMPPPGYSKKRPHVFALTLPTGAVHLFQVGTPDIAEEFVSTANYWSARLSKEPLVGSVSNIEYGWSDNVINTALLPDESGPPTSSSARQSMEISRHSIQGSIRGSLDGQRNTFRARLPADRATLMEWTPPSQSLQPSILRETEQLGALQKYVRDVEEELRGHNELRPALLVAYSPRHPNAAKAMNNWEKKSSYLLREIVKFRTYVDSLKAARVAQEELLKEQRARAADVMGFNDSTGVHAM